MDVRTCYVHFLLSFLVSGNAATIKEIVEKKAAVTSVRKRIKRLISTTLLTRC